MAWVPISKPAPEPAPAATPTKGQWVPISDPPAAEPVLEAAPSPEKHWVPIPEWKPQGLVSKDLVEFDKDGKAVYISKETGEPSETSRGFYPRGNEGPQAGTAAPVTAPPVAAPAKPKPASPSGAAYPEKSAGDDLVGSVSRGAGKVFKGVVAPFRHAVEGVAGIANPLVALVQAELGGPSLESLKGTPHEVRDPFYEIYRGLATTALTAPTDLLGGSAQRARMEGAEVLKDPEWWGEAISDTAANVTLVPGVARILGMARKAMPAKAVYNFDTVVGKVVPKYNWPDAMLGAEGANVGSKMAKGAELREVLQSMKDVDMPSTGPVTPQQVALHNQIINKIYQDSSDLVTAGAATAEELSDKIIAINKNPKNVTMQQKLGQIMDMQLSLATNHKLLDEMTNMVGRDGRPLMFAHPPVVGGSPFSTTHPRPAHIPPEYVQIPRDADMLGNFRGAYVHPDVADVLPTLQRTPEVTDWLTKYTQAWKMSKTVFSPNTHVNNVFGNVLFAHLAGNSPLNPMNAKYYRQATKEVQQLLKNDVRTPMMLEAMEDGAVRPGFANIELRQAEEMVKRPGLNLMPALYEGEDMVARYATYLKNRQTMTRRQAGIETNKYFPGYSSSSQLGRKIQTSPWGGVFTSFPMESARIYTTAAREHPWRVAGAGAMSQALLVHNLADMNMTMEDWYEYKRGLPSHMKHRTLMPFKGENGLEVADWTNFIPLAEMLSTGDSGADTGAGRSLLFGGPAWNAFKLLINYDWGVNQPVVDTSKGEGVREAAFEAFKAGAPLPNAILSGFPRTWNAHQELPPRRNAEPEGMGEAAWHSLFPAFDTRTGDELQQSGLLQKAGEINDLKRGHRSMMGNPTLSESTKERRGENIIDQLRKRAR